MIETKTQVTKTNTRTEHLNSLLKKMDSQFDSFPQRKWQAQTALLLNSPRISADFSGEPQTGGSFPSF